MLVLPYKRSVTFTLEAVIPLAVSDSYVVRAAFRDPRSRAEASAWGIEGTLTHLGPTTNPDAIAAMLRQPGLVLHDYFLESAAPSAATMLWPAPTNSDGETDLIGSFFFTDAGGNVSDFPFGDNLCLRGLYS